MAMSYSTLTGSKTDSGSIRLWQNYDKVDAEGVLEDAQAMIYQTLRVREMRMAAPITLGVGDSSAPHPSNYLDPISLRNISLDFDLDHRHEYDLERLRSYENGQVREGYAHCFSVYDGAIQFETRANLEWTGRLVYFGMPRLLSASNPTNFLTTRYPHILRAMCLAMAAEFTHNTEDYARNIQRANALIGEANAMDELSRRGMVLPVEGP